MRRLLVWAPLPFLFAAIASAQSITCTPRNGLDFEKDFCEQIGKLTRDYKPGNVAPNRALTRSAIEFSARSQGIGGVIASVLVKDPIGRNTVKLVFPANTPAKSAAEQTVGALGQILKRPATTLNVGWVIVVPATSASK